MVTMHGSGGGGAGGFREGKCSSAPGYTVSPLDAGEVQVIQFQLKLIQLQLVQVVQLMHKVDQIQFFQQLHQQVEVLVIFLRKNLHQCMWRSRRFRWRTKVGAASNVPQEGGTGNTPPVSPPQGNPGGNYGSCSGASGWWRWRWSRSSGPVELQVATGAQDGGTGATSSYINASQQYRQQQLVEVVVQFSIRYFAGRWWFRLSRHQEDGGGGNGGGAPGTLLLLEVSRNSKYWRWIRWRSRLKKS